MGTEEIIQMLKSIQKDAMKLHSGNVAHQRVHLIGDTQWLIDELSKVKDDDKNIINKSCMLNVHPDVCNKYQESSSCVLCQNFKQ